VPSKFASQERQSHPTARHHGDYSESIHKQNSLSHTQHAVLDSGPCSLL
jgi:hypothetical protein